MTSRVYGPRPSKERVCACGAAFKSGHHARCRVCRFGGREAYLASKQRERARKAEREGRTVVRPLGTREEQRATVEERKRGRMLSALARGVERLAARRAREQEAARFGVSVSSLQWARRYHNDPLFREAERIRSRDKKLRTTATVEARSDGSLTPAALVALFATAKDCPYCTQPMRSQDKSLDHIVPLSKGGAHSILNALVCCKRCNARKGTKDVATFLAKRQQLPLSVSQ